MDGKKRSQAIQTRQTSELAENKYRSHRICRKKKKSRWLETARIRFERIPSNQTPNQKPNQKPNQSKLVGSWKLLEHRFERIRNRITRKRLDDHRRLVPAQSDPHQEASQVPLDGHRGLANGWRTDCDAALTDAPNSQRVSSLPHMQKKLCMTCHRNIIDNWGRFPKKVA